MVDDVCTVNECNSASVEANAIINVKMEQKKLRLSKDKCVQIHIGKKKDDICNNVLKVHQERMKKKSSGSYLGHILSYFVVNCSKMCRKSSYCMYVK